MYIRLIVHCVLFKCMYVCMHVCRIYQAYIPELGLSNKALEMISKQEKSEMVFLFVCMYICMFKFFVQTCYTVYTNAKESDTLLNKYACTVSYCIYMYVCM